MTTIPFVIFLWLTDQGFYWCHISADGVKTWQPIEPMIAG